ncbi:MAG: hypothetical protein ABIH23_04680 [bacterium]
MDDHGSSQRTGRKTTGLKNRCPGKKRQGQSEGIEKVKEEQMKKAFIVLVILLLSATFCVAEPFFTRYSTQTGSALITTGSGYYHGVKVNLDGATEASVVVYDNTTASGTAIDPYTIYISWPSNDRWQQIRFDPPRRYYNGLYITLSGATVTVEYVPD